MHTPHTYTLMPADALNLINHMKLHVNGKIWKKGDDREMIERWKKKEQESAEAISGLKNPIDIFSTLMLIHAFKNFLR